MPHEPLALPDLLAGLPDEADYEAVYAAVMATERGRRFLAEYAKRNRHANTDMLVCAIARIEAGIRGEPCPQPIGEFFEIAAAIDRIDAALAAGKTSAIIFDAIERIQDIAYVLHERPVEQSLCDALDGVIREISDALVSPDGTPENVRKATELLHALRGRVTAMIVPSTGAAEGPAAAAADYQSFARAITAFASSLPTLADGTNPEVGAASEPRTDFAGQRDLESIEEDVTDPTPIETFVAPSDRAGDASNALSSSPPSSENVLLQAFASNPFSRGETPGQVPTGREESEDEPPSRALVSDVPPGEDLQPPRGYSRTAVVGPEEDPGDLFEPMPVPSPLAAPAVGVVEPQPPSAPHRVATTPASRAIPRPAASDPLAAVRALSEEELIALFS
jgi:hypothetical protein